MGATRPALDRLMMLGYAGNSQVWVDHLDAAGLAVIDEVIFISRERRIPAAADHIYPLHTLKKTSGR
jgi:hypothetical protein